MSTVRSTRGGPSFSLLRAVEIPPRSTGGNTDFADSRTAFDDLPDGLKHELLESNYVGAHAMAHSRKKGSPEHFRDLDPAQAPMSRHYIVQRHEPSGRMNLYVGAHLHHLEGLPPARSDELIATLNSHVTQPKYTFSVSWDQPGDMIIWDNRCVQHRAGAGTFEGRYKRDMRRPPSTTIAPPPGASTPTRRPCRPSSTTRGPSSRLRRRPRPSRWRLD